MTWLLMMKNMMDNKSPHLEITHKPQVETLSQSPKKKKTLQKKKKETKKLSSTRGTSSGGSSINSDPSPSSSSGPSPSTSFTSQPSFFPEASRLTVDNVDDAFDLDIEDIMRQLNENPEDQPSSPPVQSPPSSQFINDAAFETHSLRDDDESL